jgi:hypothetical protein
VFGLALRLKSGQKLAILLLVHLGIDGDLHFISIDIFPLFL